MFKVSLYHVMISIDVKNGFEVGDLVVGEGSESIASDLQIIKKARGYYGRVIGNRCSPMDLVSALDLRDYRYSILQGEELLKDKDPLPEGATP